MSKKIGKLARRYARALLGAVERDMGSAGSPTPAQSLATEIQSFSNLWQHDKELSSCILSPAFKREEREQALTGVCKQLNLSPVATRFISTLFERDRISAVLEMTDAFSGLAEEAAGVVSVQVITASAILEDEVREITTDLSRHISGTPNFMWSVDPALLGGMVVKYQGKVLDGSVRGQLERLERSLLLGPV